MNSFKVISFLLVVGLCKSAPQISERGVVNEVLGQLQPSIANMVAQILGRRTVTTTVGLGQGVPTGATGAVRSTSFEQGATSAAKTANVQSSSVSSSSSSASRFSEAELTSSVVASLQPSIAAAVAEALKASSASSSSFSKQSSISSVASSGVAALTEAEEAELNAKLSANAQYEYGYKVADDEAQAYMAHQEVRNGLNVEGTYNYVDANGALVTVTYTAGPDGYVESRDVQDGAVDMRTTYGAWEGPFADTVPAGVTATANGGASAVTSVRGVSTATKQTSSAASQADLIAQILAALQPQISSAVQSALSASTSSVSSSSSGSSFNTAQTNSVVGTRQVSSTVGQSQNSLVSTIIGQLQPQISGAVKAALRQSSTVAVRPVAAVRPVVQTLPVARPALQTSRSSSASSSGISGIFGVAGENSVRIETPEYTIGY